MASTPSRVDTAKGRSILNTVALVLLIVGGLNWALVGLFEFDLVATLFGDMSPLSRIVYILVGIAALIAFTLFGRIRTDRALR